MVPARQEAPGDLRRFAGYPACAPYLPKKRGPPEGRPRALPGMLLPENHTPREFTDATGGFPLEVPVNLRACGVVGDAQVDGGGGVLAAGDQLPTVGGGGEEAGDPSVADGVVDAAVAPAVNRLDLSGLNELGGGCGGFARF